MDKPIVAKKGSGGVFDRGAWENAQENARINAKKRSDEAKARAFLKGGDQELELGDGAAKTNDRIKKGLMNDLKLSGQEQYLIGLVRKEGYVLTTEEKEQIIEFIERLGINDLKCFLAKTRNHIWPIDQRRRLLKNKSIKGKIEYRKNNSENIKGKMEYEKQDSGIREIILTLRNGERQKILGFLPVKDKIMTGEEAHLHSRQWKKNESGENRQLDPDEIPAYYK